MPTRPGFHPSTSFSEYPEPLAKAIRGIARNFYVTRSFQKEMVQNSEYWGLLARPSEDFSIHLNADRELLFLFSNYSSFEIRTIEAFDLFYAQLEQKRVDPSIRFIISNDPRIEEKITHYLRQNPEYPIIVPIYLPTISEHGSGLLAAIRRNYLLRDLFGYQNPLREETFFFGRHEQVNAILDLAKSGQSSSIFGLRKSGKTSTIYAIIRRAKSFDCTPVLVDCQSPAIHARNYSELLTHLVEEARRAIGQSKPLPALQGSDAEVSEAFSAQMKNVLGQAKSNILFVFDEIENITPGTAASKHWEEGRDSLFFWQNIRSFIQQDSKGRLAVCIVGTSPRLLEMPRISGVANPMYLFSQKRFLPSFSFEDTRNMIDRLGFFMGMEFDATQIANIHKTYGGHPFFIRQVCSIIHQDLDLNRPIQISDKKILSAITKFGAQLDAYLTDILKNLKDNYTEEYDLLGAVVSGDLNEITEYGIEAPELIDHLIGYGIVELRGQEYDIRFEAIRHALEKTFKKNESVEDFWKEIMLRRNRLESDIRRELLIFSKGLSKDMWQQILASNLSNARFEKLPSIEPRVLFSTSDSPLFWTDLMYLLRSEGVLPYLGARRSAIIKAMNLVNEKGRKDAHSKAPSTEDMNCLRTAFTALESEFSVPD